MNALGLLLETTPMRALGWTLVHFVWQGMALFVLHVIIQAMLRKRPPSARYVAACLVLLAMITCAGLTMRLEVQRFHVGIGNVLAEAATHPVAARRTLDDTAREGATPPVVASNVSDPHTPQHQGACSKHRVCVDASGSDCNPCGEAAGTAVAQRNETGPGAALDRARSLALQPLNFLHGRAPRLADLLPWLVSLWLLGVFFLTTRLAIGWQEARWLRDRAVRPVAEPTVAAFQHLVRQLRISRPVKLLESSLAEVPTVVGWLHPVVLLPAAAVTGMPPRHLEALITHELTHVKRHDYLVNLLQTMVETLLFYHPAVWWVSNRIRDEREHCCDDVAVRVCGDAVVYARALTTMEELRRGSLRPELAMAADGGSLVQRVRRLVGRGGEPAAPGAGVVIVAILVGLSSLVAVSAGRSTEAPALAASLPAGNGVETLETVDLGGKIAGIQEAQPAPQLPRPGAVSVRPEPAFALDEILQLEQFEVDVDYYDEMTALFGDLQVDELLALKMYDIDRPFAEDMAQFFGALDPQELVALKMYDVVPDYVEEMSELFEEELEFDEIIHLSQQGVQSEDVRELMAQGVDVDLHEAIALHMMGVEPDQLQQLAELQMPNASMDDIVQLSRLGLDADDVAELQQQLGPLTVDQSIALLTNGVDAGEVEDLQDMGMRNPDVETLVHMYCMGLTAGVIDDILDDDMADIPVETLLLFKELGLEDVFFDEFRRRNR